MSLAKHRRCSGEGVGLATLYRAFTAKVFVALLSMLGVVEQSRLDVRAIMINCFGGTRMLFVFALGVPFKPRQNGGGGGDRFRKILFVGLAKATGERQVH